MEKLIDGEINITREGIRGSMRRNNNRMRKLTIEVDADKASPVIFSLFESSVIPIQQIMEGTTQPLLFGLES